MNNHLLLLLKKCALQYSTRNYIVVLCVVFGVFLGMLLGEFWSKGSSNTQDLATPGLRLSQKEYSLINPLLLCGVSTQNFNEDKLLKQKMSTFVEERVKNGDATAISVYVLEYKTGRWAGVNENERYTPASLLKVPIMIAYLQQATKDPWILSKRITFMGVDENKGEFFKSGHSIRPGETYSIEELVRSMITDSDNNATRILVERMDKEALFEVYTDLGLPLPPNTPTVEYLSAKSYAYFFRILYNATYLSREYSQKALEFLSHADFQQGLRAGIPRGVVVAQKFGERTNEDRQHKVLARELHDCGIVYKPNAPYLVCVMSKGGDFAVLAKNIKDISTLVYENIN